MVSTFTFKEKGIDCGIYKYWPKFHPEYFSSTSCACHSTYDKLKLTAGRWHTLKTEVIRKGAREPV